MDEGAFRDELFTIRGRYQRTLTDLDYGRILKESLAAYERAAAGKTEAEKLALRKELEAFLFSRVAALLHRAEYKDFVHMLKAGGY